MFLWCRAIDDNIGDHAMPEHFVFFALPLSVLPVAVKFLKPQLLKMCYYTVSEKKKLRFFSTRLCQTLTYFHNFWHESS